MTREQGIAPIGERAQQRPVPDAVQAVAFAFAVHEAQGGHAAQDSAVGANGMDERERSVMADAMRCQSGFISLYR
jgi:hypothetical protein